MNLALELQDLAVDIAREAGALALQRRREGVQVAATKSSMADIVTEADREVEQLVRTLLSRARPDDGFLGEEFGAEHGESEITWVVDPIDGTVNYAFGIPAWAVSVAAVSGGADPAAWEVQAGAVYNPVTDEMFRAAIGHGAWLGEDRLVVNPEPGEAGGLIATGFGYDPATHEPAFEQLRRVMPLARDIRRIGAASLDLAYVAAGRLDAYYEKGLHPWDMAAGTLLVTEAGGMVGGAPSDRPGRQMTIAAGPGLYTALTDVLDF